MPSILRSNSPLPFVVALVLVLAACGGETGSTLGPPATLEVLAGGAQSIPVEGVAPIAPRVRVRDANGASLPNVAILFSIDAGGGSVTPARVVTGTDGVAVATTWTMGSVPGVNTLRAAAENTTVSNTISVTATVVPPSMVAAVGSANFVAFAGQPLTTLPVLEVRDGFGAVKPGVTVVFSVTLGGGTVTGGTQVTNAAGRASPTGWTLGPLAGVNQLTAQLPAGERFIFTAQGLGANITTLELISPAAQTGTLGFQVPVIPRVRVVDALGAPVPNIPVAFALTGFGDATMTGPVALSDATGIASPQDWKLGRVNPTSTLVATVPGFPGPRAEFTATGTAKQFVVDLRLLTIMKASQRDAFVTAATRWMAVITDDISDVQITRPAGDCGSGSPAIDEFVDDVIIFAAVENIDGPGGVLGSAGPCTIRSPSALPAVGRMRFDDADLVTRENNGQLVPLILHEMGHVLGFGTIWTDRGVITDKGGNDPIFVGTQALALWPTLTLGYAGRPVPVENTFGPGTADAHWRESVFRAELMTGFIESPGVPMPLSRMTIASMRDLGYVVNYDAGDTFAGSLVAMLREINSVPTRINEVVMLPTTSVDVQGVTRPINRR
ncbi:MAG: hypothetical protein IPO52_00720 [Gemmatimonadetes bacterium]|nr:hypothetical protein [Gemmatimonadota bacterium]